jgi:hypothetical protein
VEAQAYAELSRSRDQRIMFREDQETIRELSRSRDQRIMFGEVQETMRAMHDNHSLVARDINRSAYSLHQDMRNDQKIYYLGGLELQSILVENNTRVIERILDEQASVRSLIMYLSVVIVYLAYLFGALQTENAWLRTTLTSTPEGPRIGQSASPRLDRDMLVLLRSASQWIPSWSNVQQAIAFIAFWPIKALLRFLQSTFHWIPGWGNIQQATALVTVWPIRALLRLLRSAFQWIPGWSTVQQAVASIAVWPIRAPLRLLQSASQRILGWSTAQKAIAFVTTRPIRAPLRLFQSASQWIPSWSNVQPIAALIAVWTIRALACFSTYLQFDILYDKYVRKLKDDADLMLKVVVTLIFGFLKSLAIYLTVAKFSLWIFVGCLLDCFFLLLS